MNLIKTAAALSVAVAIGMTSAMAQSLPDFPVTIKSASGAMTDGVIYAGLGTAGKSWYKIDTKAQDPKWEEVASFPGDARDQSQSVALNGKIYVFGGCGKSSATGLTTVFNDVWAYDPANDSWEKVMTRSPFGMTGHSAITVDGKNAIVLGSVNKAIFDGYFEDLQTAAGNDELLAKVNADYSNKPVEDYYFNREVMQYNPETNMWSSLGQMPTTGTAGAALAADGNKVTVINGERKPGLRTAVTSQFTVEDYGLAWTQLPNLCPADGESVQEGVAGAMAGVSNGAVIVAGGANFPGSTVEYDKNGKLFAHQGKTKTWRDEIYALVDGQWVHSADLPLPLGYGITVQNGDEVILIGGETTGGTATSQVITLSFANGKVVVE